MDKHLDKVLQPDGSYKWELVELRAENLYEKDKPAPEPAVEPRKRKTKESVLETPETPETEF
jgi:hypothetical protein